MVFNINKIVSFSIIFLGSIMTTVGLIKLGLDFIQWVEPVGWHIRTVILGIIVMGVGYFLNRKGIL